MSAFLILNMIWEKLKANNNKMWINIARTKVRRALWNNLGVSEELLLPWESNKKGDSDMTLLLW